jgi:hypothetical protein
MPAGQGTVAVPVAPAAPVAAPVIFNQSSQRGSPSGQTAKDTQEQSKDDADSNTDDAGTKSGRAGKQARLRDVGDDPKASSSDRGWIKNEQRQIDQGNRDTIRNPPGKDLAHERGREAAKGYDYEHSNLQDRDLHRLQHKYDDFGRANKERPVDGN